MLGAIANPPKSEDKYVEKVFNWSEVHLSEMTCYKIHTLEGIFFHSPIPSLINFVNKEVGKPTISLSTFKTDKL